MSKLQLLLPCYTAEFPPAAVALDQATVDQFWDCFWSSAPTSFHNTHTQLHLDGFDNARAITLLLPEDFGRYDVPLRHCSVDIMGRMLWGAARNDEAHPCLFRQIKKKVKLMVSPVLGD